MDASLPIVFGAGMATLVTPCVLPLVPLYLGMVMGTGIDAARAPGGRARLLLATAAFGLGFTAVFTLMGLGASAAASLVARHRDLLMAGGGLLIVVFGLKFLGLMRIPWLDSEARLPALRTGHRLLDAALFGVVFALGWTPCVGPILGSVLTYTAARGSDPLAGALYLSVYGLGMAAPLLVLAAFLDRLLPLLDRVRGRMALIERVTGGALVALGVFLVASGLVALRPSGDPGDRGWTADSGQRVPALGEASSRPRLVELYRTDCPVCAEVMPGVERLREDCTGRRIDILSVNVSEPRNAGAAEHFGVTAVPTFVLVDAAGTQKARIVGGLALSDLRRAAATLMAESCVGMTAGDLSSGEGGCPAAPSPDDPAPLLIAPSCS